MKGSIDRSYQLSIHAAYQPNEAKSLCPLLITRCKFLTWQICLLHYSQKFPHLQYPISTNLIILKIWKIHVVIT